MMIATVETSFVESKTIITDDETTTPTTTSTTIKKESRKRKCAILTKLTDTPLELIPLPAHVNMDKVINYNISQADETYALNRQVEMKYALPAPSSWIKFNSDINPNMRRILIDWLVEVAGEFKYCTETLHLCVSYLDRALATLTIINSRNLQLVGIVCLWIAYLHYVRGHLLRCLWMMTCAILQTKRMEMQILLALHFALTVKTPFLFFQRFSHACQLDERTTCLAEYLMEILLHEIECCSFPPSIIATSVIFLALYTTQQSPWPSALQESSGYQLTQVQACVHCLHQVHKQVHASEITYKSIQRKYAVDGLHNVSKIQPVASLDL